MIQYYLLPALTAWVIGFPLGTLGIGAQWWAVFALGGLLLGLVFVAEYIAVDFSDIRHAPATVGLMALSFALYLILAIAIRAAGLRLYLALPAVGVPIFLVVLRTLYLRLNGRWCLIWAGGIGLVIVQIAAGLQYLPVSPLAYGLFLVGPAYALTSIASSVEEGRTWRGMIMEPAIMLALTLILALLIGG